MIPLLPGDRMWGRYRVERLIGNGLAGAWLTAVSDLPRSGESASARFLLVQLQEPAPHPLAELLTLLRLTLRFDDTPPKGSPRKRAGRRVRVQQYGRKVLPVFGEVEWIGEQSGEGVAILSAPAAVPLNTWLQSSGTLSAAQALPLLLRFTRGLAQLAECVEVTAPRPAVLEQFFRALARLLNPSAVALGVDSAQLTLHRHFPAALAANAPPLYPDFLAPELFRLDSVSSTTLVFGMARLAAVLTGQKIESERTPEAAWARLAEWASGKRDPAREFTDGAAAAALPAELRELFARCLSKNRSRRVPTLDKMATRLKEMAIADWAQNVAQCPACGFVLTPEQAAQPCVCCGLTRSSVNLVAVTGGASLEAGRLRKRNTTTLLKGRSQSGTMLAVPKIEGMTAIEAGMFLSGEDKTPRSLRGFAIDTYPVTEIDYKKYLVALGKKARPEGPGSRDTAFDKHPVTSATWYEANEFAEHYGKRLPTIFEWEKAARGCDGRKFPFGNVLHPDMPRMRGGGEGQPKRVENPGTFAIGSWPESASPFGIQDLIANVLQWTSSARRAGDRLFRAVKGSCFLDGSPELSRCASVQYLPPESSEPHLGFRCVKDFE